MVSSSCEKKMGSKIVERELVKGEYFRIAGPNGIAPDVWTWDGNYENPAKRYGFICRRLADNFKTILYPTDYIVPLEFIEDF